MTLKKSIALILVLCVVLSACGGAKKQAAEGVDVDLSVLSGAVVYGKVNDMVTNGADYQDQIIRMEGIVNTIPVKEKGELVDTLYSCVIMDATKCCSQGIEFVLKEGEYPIIGKTVTVQGRWDWYQLYGISRYRLLDAVIIQ